MAYGSCLLGAINLSEFVQNGEFKFDHFTECVQDAVVALNEVLDEGIDLHPLEKQKEVATQYRQIGLGLFGLADALIKMELTYGEKNSLDMCDSIGHTFKNAAVQASANLAEKQGVFPQFNYEIISKSPFFQGLSEETKEIVKQKGLRNSQLLTIAPNGSTSTMLGVSGGVEPTFAFSFIRSTHNEDEADTFQFKVFSKVAKDYMDKHGLTSENDLPKWFIKSQDVPYRNRVDMQSVWQNHIDASISSTVNLPEEASIEDVADLYTYAWEKGLKGITVYRDNCERAAVLLTKPKEGPKVTKLVEETPLTGLFAKCPGCQAEGTMFQSNGCATCSSCGFSPCS